LIKKKITDSAHSAFNLRTEVRQGFLLSLVLKEIENKLHIAVKAKAKEGEANKELIRFLAKHYKCRPIIKSGLRSKIKIIELS